LHSRLNVRRCRGLANPKGRWHLFAWAGRPPAVDATVHAEGAPGSKTQLVQVRRGFLAV